MSGIDLLLRTAIDYERTHQIALFTLLSKSKLPEILVNAKLPSSIKWEPEGQLFDLSINDDTNSTFIELKMWAPLSDSQFKRQKEFIIKNKVNCLYLLLGTSWFERTGKSIIELSNDTARKIGYEELILSLNNLMIATGQSSEIYELALAYRNALHEQYNRIENAYKNKDFSKLYYYSIYHKIQSRLNGIETSIYTVNNPGGPVYILNNTEYWRNFQIGQMTGELYYEIVNGRLCIKFHTDVANDMKYIIRENVRKAIKNIFGSSYQVIDSGRIGAYMTACQIEHDFTDINKFDQSAEIFLDIASKFEEVIKSIV